MFSLNYNAYTVISQTVEEAVANGAELFWDHLRCNHGENDVKNVDVYSLGELCRQIGCPIYGEYYPAYSDKLTKEEMHEQVYRCRILTEIGCDMIKTFYTNQGDNGELSRAHFRFGAEKSPPS